MTPNVLMTFCYALFSHHQRSPLAVITSTADVNKPSQILVTLSPKVYVSINPTPQGSGIPEEKEAETVWEQEWIEDPKKTRPSKPKGSMCIWIHIYWGSMHMACTGLNQGPRAEGEERTCRYLKSKCILQLIATWIWKFHLLQRSFTKKTNCS